MTDSTQVATIERQPRSVLVDMADRYGMEPAPFEATLRATVCKGNVSREEFAAFLLVAKEYRLNPLTKEIYAFPAKGGGIQPIVSIDGWCRIINEQPVLDGVEFVDVIEGGELIAVTCHIHRKDRTRPTSVTEYMGECRRTTDVWKTWPARMLRHKALIQCARYAFGFSGIVDPDEYERITSVPVPQSPGLSARLAAGKATATEGFSTTQAQAQAHAQASETPHDPDTGEVIDADFEEGDGALSADEQEMAAALEQDRAKLAGMSQDVGPAADDFPGDRKDPPAPPAQTQGPTLSMRAEAYEARLREAPSEEKLKAYAAAAKALCADLDQADPERLAELNALFEARMIEFSDLRAAGGQ
jgi:phage recombination protein Bet